MRIAARAERTVGLQVDRVELLRRQAMIDRARLRAPREQLSVLIEPRSPALASSIGDRLGQARILDTTVADLRDRLRERLGLRSPVIVTGHQAEFFHPGVFAKNLATEHLGAARGGSSLFITVDSDQLKHRELIVPQITNAGLRRVAVPFSEAPSDLPCEWLEPQSREHWLGFFTRVASLLEGYDDSLLRPFTSGWLADDDPLEFCSAMTRGVAAVERDLGLESTQDLRISDLSASPEFLAFVAHLMLNAPDFVHDYNDAQRAYRQRFHIRSPHKPVELLDVSADRLELPFWISRAGEPRRRLHISTKNDAVSIFADRDLAGCIPRSTMSRADAVADGWREALDGWHIRPRALTLSCFARLFVADLFVHGIGGGRYDAMTEDFSRGFFGVDLPDMACVTATVYMPLPRRGVDRKAVLTARRASRDVRFNPQRHVRDVPAAMMRHRDELVRRSRSLRESHPKNHVERRAVFSAIRDANERMIEIDPHRPAALDREVEQLERDAAQDRVALDREYFFALHRKSDIQRLLELIRQSLDRAI